MLSINLDLLSGKVIKEIYLEEIYSGKSLFLVCEDGTILEVHSIYDGGVCVLILAPITDKEK